MVRGETKERGGRRYEYLGVEPYTNRKGEEIELQVYRSQCATCGAPFEVKVIESTRFWMTWCPACRRKAREWGRCANWRICPGWVDVMLVWE